MGRGPLLIGGLVLAMRVATFPRTPWDPEELRFPFTAMIILTVAASVLTAVALAKAYGSAMSLLFSFSAAVLVHGGSARLEVVAWMFVALALLVLGGATIFSTAKDDAAVKPATPQRWWLFGALAGAAVACHPPLLFAVLALLVAAKHRQALLPFAVLAFPFLRVPENLPAIAELNVVRFVLHPWGSKWVFLPLFACVVLGGFRMVGHWKREREPLLWFAIVHIATGLAFVNPADGARWAVPSLMLTALVASRAGWTGAIVVSVLSLWYAYPVLRDRVLLVSPPVQASRAIPKDVVVLHDREMAPFVGGMPLDEGLRTHLRTNEPLVYAASGLLQGARVFSRPERDVYGKLTGNAYRQVSLLPIEFRFAPLSGVFGLERNERGESWRWLEREAAVALPRGRQAVHLELRSPIDNVVAINGRSVRLPRGQVVAIDVPPADVLVFRAEREHPLAAPDTRIVAVQLLRIEYR